MVAVQAIVSFLAIIIIVVSVHELGHYLAARFFGVRVLRFSIGFGKAFFSRRDRHGTEWVLAPIPLGGYVQMLDRQTAKEKNLNDVETLEACPHWKRIIIFFAGPFANFVLSAVVLVGVLSAGEVGLAPLIGEVRENSPAARAGMTAGEELSGINDDAVYLWRDAEYAVLDAAIAADGITLSTSAGARYSFAASVVSPAELESGVFNKLGVYRYDEYIRPEVASVIAESPADVAGLESGDIFVAVNGQVVDYWRHLTAVLHAHPNGAVTLLLWRDSIGGITATATLTAAKRGTRTVGQLGVLPKYDLERFAAVLVTVNRSAAETVAAAVRQVAADVARTFAFVQLLLRNQLSPDNLSGPVGIAVQSGQAAKYGWDSWLRFVALISVSLGVLNLLPLPLLDGGHILLSVMQILYRREFQPAVLRWWELSGFFLLMSLMAWVVVSDIMQLL